MYVTENTRDAAQSRWGSTSAFNTAPLTPPPRRLRRYTTEWDVPDMWSFLVAMDLSIDKLPHPATDMMTIDDCKPLFEWETGLMNWHAPRCTGGGSRQGLSESCRCLRASGLPHAGGILGCFCSCLVPIDQDSGSCSELYEFCSIFLGFDYSPVLTLRIFSVSAPPLRIPRSGKNHSLPPEP